MEVSRRMTSLGALAGYEENGGFMYGRHNQVRDGLMTLALMLSVLESSELALSENALRPAGLVLPPRTRSGATPAQASRLIEALHRAHPDADVTDGIKISLGPSRWVMVRPSGTEPIVRIYAEGSLVAGLGLAHHRVCLYRQGHPGFSVTAAATKISKVKIWPASTRR